MQLGVVIVLCVAVTVPVVVALVFMIWSGLRVSNQAEKEAIEEDDGLPSTREVSSEETTTSPPRLRDLVIENIRKKRNVSTSTMQSSNCLNSGSVVSQSELIV